jgi:hypothetical protein
MDAEHAPAGPQDERAQNRHRRRVPPEVGRVDAAVCIEALAAWAQHFGADEVRDAADEVHDAAARKVDHADAEQWAAVVAGQPAVRLPHPAVRYDPAVGHCACRAARSHVTMRCTVAPVCNLAVTLAAKHLTTARYACQVRRRKVSMTQKLYHMQTCSKCGRRTSALR